MNKVVKKSKPNKAHVTLKLSARQITALIVAIDESQSFSNELSKQGLSFLLPAPLKGRFHLHFGKILKDFRESSPGQELTLRLPRHQYMTLMLFCLITCQVNSPPSVSTSQVERDIEAEIFGQLVQLLPEGIKHEFLEPEETLVAKVAERRKRKENLRLLPNRL